MLCGLMSGENIKFDECDFCFVSTEKCMPKAKVLTEKAIKPVKSTMKLHAVTGFYCVALLNPEYSYMCDM